ncbi:MAG: dihydroneopterin aldolase [Waddliaceae bacterium]
MKRQVLGNIGFENYAIVCIIGCLPEERVKEQTIYVDLKVEVDISRCLQTDELQDTLDISLLAKCCADRAKIHRFRMIETYAGEVLQTLFDRFPMISRAWMKVKKPQGLPSADSSIVELMKERE